MSEIGIVGGGLVGSAIAVWLLSEGHEVTLFEADLSARHASSGNAGLLATPETDPIVSLETLKSVPQWLLDPLGPLALRWRDIPAMAPWLIAYLLSARPSAAKWASNGLIELSKTALADHKKLAELARMEPYFLATGSASVYADKKSLEKEFAHRHPLHAALGHQVELWSADQLRQQVPAMTGQFAGAIFSPDYHVVTDPRLVLEGLRNHIASAGRIIEQDVTSIENSGERNSGRGIALKTADGKRHTFEKLVIAAGVWSAPLVRQSGLKVLLETERGYNTTWATSPIKLPMPLGFSEHAFYASPLNGQLRVGGAVELARPDAPPNMARAKALRAAFRRYVPDLPDEGGVEWMGRRPSTPDGLPVISAHPRNANIFMAFGHGHLGLTFSATTGRRIARLVAGENDPAMEPFSVARFQ